MKPPLFRQIASLIIQVSDVQKIKKNVKSFPKNSWQERRDLCLLVQTFSLLLLNKPPKVLGICKKSSVDSCIRFCKKKRPNMKMPGSLELCPIILFGRGGFYYAKL